LPGRAVRVNRSRHEQFCTPATRGVTPADRPRSNAHATRVARALQLARSATGAEGNTMRMAAVVMMSGLLGARLVLGATAEEAQAEVSAGALTHRLAALGGEYRRARGAARQRVGRVARDLAAQREARLLTLLEENPGEVLRAVLPESVRTTLPAAARRHVEEEAQVEGELEVVVEDGPTESRVRHAVRTAAGLRFALHFAAEAPALA
jgi:hypothetical protein